MNKRRGQDKQSVYDFGNRPNEENAVRLILRDVLLEEIAKRNITTNVEQIINNVDSVEPITDAALILFDSIQSKMVRIAKKNFTDNEKFRKRNIGRWRSGIDYLEVLISAATELGSDFNNEYRSSALERGDHVFEALVHLHARAVLISREVVCLIQGGFADGALGRWRTLHEVAVIAVFLSESEDIISERYLASFGIQRYRAVRQYQEFADIGELNPYSSEQIKLSTEEYTRIVKKYGSEIDSDYGWAYPVLRKKNSTFRDIEKNVRLDHWRPRYRWASMHGHGNFYPSNLLLGLVESEEQILLVGPSNSGMTDPANMSALSLTMATSALILRQPDIYRVTAIRMLYLLTALIGEEFYRIQKDSSR